MTNNLLPPGLVLWPDAGGALKRICVLISDIHCTDGSVGNQTADETDWKSFFCELEVMLAASISANSEILLILNGDVVDLLRSGKWTAAGVYPWQRTHADFQKVLLSIMHDIVEMHAHPSAKGNGSSGFFHYLQNTVKNLKQLTSRVIIVPVVGNHDKELQVVPEARKIYYQQCLGLAEDDMTADYRNWVAGLMGSDPVDPWPLLPFYVADPALRLFATHGQWRDHTNSRVTPFWKFGHGWQPECWQREQYRAFSDPCFGDTIASGLISHFIWNTTLAIEQNIMPDALVRNHPDELAGIERIKNVLREMDLYRPSVSAVVCLLEEARKLDRSNEHTRLLYRTVIDQYRLSLQSWLAYPETFSTAPLVQKIVLSFIALLSRLHWTWLDTYLMRLMAYASEIQGNTPFAKLPAFHADYRILGFRLHVEGHTHVAMEVDLRYSPPKERRNYTYVNLGAWRDRIVQKFGSKGFRRRSIGRCLIVQGCVNAGSADSAYGFTLRDITSWGDGLDRW
jgi:UDP-2,3-diacylglucosamine pyrophosphatase LpxH